MTDKLQAQVNLGAKAELFLHNEPVQKAFKDLEAEYIRAWAQSLPGAVQERENLWRALQILGDVKQQLGTMISGGRIAQREIDMTAQKAKVEELRKRRV